MSFKISQKYYSGDQVWDHCHRLAFGTRAFLCVISLGFNALWTQTRIQKADLKTHVLLKILDSGTKIQSTVSEIRKIATTAIWYVLEIYVFNVNFLAFFAMASKTLLCHHRKNL